MYLFNLSGSLPFPFQDWLDEGGEIFITPVQAVLINSLQGKAEKMQETSGRIPSKEVRASSNFDKSNYAGISDIVGIWIIRL